MFGNRYKFLLVSIVMFSIMIGCSSESKTLKLTPSKLNFESVYIGDSVTLDVVLKNKYSDPIEISEIKFDGSTEYSLSAGGPLPINLDKNAEHTITVEFKPISDGEIYAVMSLTHDGSLKPKLMNLSGIGIAVPRIEISEQSHDYEYGLVNDDYDYDFTIKNTGSADLSIDNYAFTGVGATGYVIAAGGTTPTVIVPNATHTITVRFAPTVTGTFTANLEIISNAIVNPTLTVALDGEAVTSAPKLEVDQTSPWDFGSVATSIPAIKAIELKSTGLSDLNVTAINFATGVEFTLDHVEDAGGNTITLPQTVGIGDKIYAMIKFAPTGVAAYNDTMSIVHDGIYGASPLDIQLKGDGRNPFEKKFNFTGAAQQWTVPAGVTALVVECYGAAGAQCTWNSTEDGGKGGMAKATVSVTPGDTVYVYVGGEGQNVITSATGGWNGGGGTNGGCSTQHHAQGGGASDIRIGGDTLNDRIVVGAGGGGAGLNIKGGDGGGLTGDNGPAGSGVSANPGGGGTQTAGGAAGASSAFPGAFGQGGRGKGTNCGGGGGGGGWYGGGGGQSGAGGGGSSYYDAPGNTDKSTQKGVKTGDGEVIIRY